MSKQVSDALRLCVITVAAGFALGGIYMITKEPIAAQEIKVQQEAYRAVLGAADGFEELAGEEYTKEKIGETFTELLANDPEAYTSDEITGLVAGIKDGKCVGLVVTVNAHDGYAGDIKYSVGVDPDGTLKGISLLEISETAGLGQRAKTDPSFLGQYQDKHVEKFVVVKDGSGAGADDKIDAIGGSTITSKSITRGVNAALLAAREVKGSQVTTVGGVVIE